jgi:hypothetical protein
MQFRTIKDAIVSILGAAEAGRYRTIGYQERSQAATEVLNNNRSVSVYFSSGDLPKSGGSLTGPFKHDATYKIDLVVSKSAQGDLATINNPASTPAQLTTALANISEATALADGSLDELYDVIFNVLLDAQNVDFGLDIGNVSNRWISNLDKHQPIERGSLVVLTGVMQLNCTMTEVVEGDPGTDIQDPIMDAEIVNNNQNGVPDAVGKAGTLTGG